MEVFYGKEARISFKIMHFVTNKRMTPLADGMCTSAVKSLSIHSKEDRFAFVRHCAALCLSDETSRLFTRVETTNSLWRNG